jgi:hypothetical protein
MSLPQPFDRLVDTLVDADTPIKLAFVAVALLIVPPLYVTAGYAVRHRTLRGLFRRWWIVILGAPFIAFAGGAMVDAYRGMPTVGVCIELALALLCAAALGLQVARRYEMRHAES